jgi:uridylate kinase
MASNKYKRVLLKLSGEALMGDDQYGINQDVLARVADDINSVHKQGVQLAIVVGGGNIFRGISDSANGMNRSMADNMGMLATIMNAVALKDSLGRLGVPVHIMSGLPIPRVVDAFVAEKAVEHLESGNVMIFSAGTGNPFFTTDTAASLRGLEINADIVFKATKVDGIFDKDPVKYADAIKFERLTYDEVLEKRLEVMDAAAIALCRDNNMPLGVFNMNKNDSLMQAICGKFVGTIVEAGAAP